MATPKKSADPARHEAAGRARQIALGDVLCIKIARDGRHHHRAEKKRVLCNPARKEREDGQHHLQRRSNDHGAAQSR